MFPSPSLCLRPIGESSECFRMTGCLTLRGALAAGSNLNPEHDTRRACHVEQLPAEFHSSGRPV
jgi:hypothetical protein